MVVQKSEVKDSRRKWTGVEDYEWSKVAKKITENDASIKYKYREIRQSLKLLQVKGLQE